MTKDLEISKKPFLSKFYFGILSWSVCALAVILASYTTQNRSP